MRENPLKLYRGTINLSQEQLAAQSGISIRKLTDYEAGRDLPNKPALAKLKAVLGEQAKWLDHQLMDWPGFYPTWFSKQDRKNEQIAARVKHSTTYLRAEVNLNLAEADDLELRATVLNLLDITDRLLLRWAAAAEQRQHHRATDLVAAAEQLREAAQSIYDASHPVFADPQESYHQTYRHRYPGDDDPEHIARLARWRQEMQERREQRKQAEAEGRVLTEPAFYELT